MGKVLKVDATDVESFLKIDLPSNEPEIVVEFRLGLPLDTRNFFKNSDYISSQSLIDIGIVDPPLESGDIEPVWIGGGYVWTQDGGYQLQPTMIDIQNWEADTNPVGGLLRSGFAWEPTRNTLPYHTAMVEPDWSSVTGLGFTIEDGDITWTATAYNVVWSPNTTFTEPTAISPTVGTLDSIVIERPLSDILWIPNVQIVNLSPGVAGWKSTVIITADTPEPAISWQNCKIHFVNGGPFELFINDAHVLYGNIGKSVDAHDVKIGQILVDGGSFGKIYYFDDFKIRITEDDDPIFEDDFESGTFDLWTSYEGEVSIVDDPDPPPEPGGLVWDTPGERIYQTGIDRGVLYLQNGSSAVWNGLTSVEENPSGELKSFYLNGVKYLEYLSPGDFSATLKAFTYPDEFDLVNGILKSIPGFHIHDQPSRSFGLSYRTKIGNDLDGIDAAYFIHLLYNVIANSESSESSTIGEIPEPFEFSWGLSARPIRNSSITWRPTAHISIDSREISQEVLQAFEEILYGTESTAPRLPSIEEIPDLLS